MLTAGCATVGGLLTLGVGVPESSTAVAKIAVPPVTLIVPIASVPLVIENVPPFWVKVAERPKPAEQVMPASVPPFSRTSRC
jgi:hypothetical protein